MNVQKRKLITTTRWRRRRQKKVEGRDEFPMSHGTSRGRQSLLASIHQETVHPMLLCPRDSHHLACLSSQLYISRSIIQILKSSLHLLRSSLFNSQQALLVTLTMALIKVAAFVLASLLFLVTARVSSDLNLSFKFILICVYSSRSSACCCRSLQMLRSTSWRYNQ